MSPILTQEAHGFEGPFQPMLLGLTIFNRPAGLRPVAPASAAHDPFFPSLSVSPTGLVGVSWLDRRNDPADVKYQAFAAISTDGGQTFPNNATHQGILQPRPERGSQPDGRLHRQHLGGRRLHRRLDGQQQGRRHRLAASFSRARLDDSPALAGATPPRLR
jgi:hypothetical protein